MGNQNSGRQLKRVQMQYEEHRKKIKTSAIINRLTRHSLGEQKTVKIADGKDENGKRKTRSETVPLMDPSQVQAAQILLRKVLPDMKEVAVQADVDAVLEVIYRDPTKRK